MINIFFVECRYSLFKIDEKVLENIEKSNVVPESILEQSTSIKASYQNKIWNILETSEKAFPEEITTDSCYTVLSRMCQIYRWDVEETKGRNPLLKDLEQLK